MRVPVLTPRAFRRLTFANVVLLAAVIVSGATVRLTNSGLGCSEWPSCKPDDFVSISSQHEAIEQLNRLFSGAIGVPIALTLFFAYRMRPRRTDLIRLGWTLLALFFGNAVLGGIAVIVKLAWVSVMGHFLLAIAAVATALVLHKRAGEPDGPRTPVVSRGLVRFAGAIYALTLWVIVLGTLVTAVGPHGGDADAERLRWPISDVARVHGFSVDLLVALVCVFVFMLVRAHAPRRVLTAVSVVLLTMIGQGILGYVQYARAIPPLLVGFHVAGAVAVFASVQWLLLELRAPSDTGSAHAALHAPEDTLEVAGIAARP